MTADKSKSSPAEAPQGEYGAHSSTHSSLTYNTYLKVLELKELQFCQSDPAHHDEPLFIIIHQTYELWFKLILHEIDEAIILMDKGQVRKANWFLRRIVAIFKVLVDQIHILETMSPRDFLGFRSALNPASGFQSSQFREIEIACGMRDKMLMEHFRSDDAAYRDLQRRANQPSLRNAFYQLLRHKGFMLPEMNDCDGERSPEDEKEANVLENQRIQELRKLYESIEKYGDLHDLAETLVDIDEQIALWRTHHVTVVERVIGFKRGTGGSEGVGYLRTTLTKRCFPDLWKVRTVLEL
jgi:tryptophan 2,3-dioxygenase